MLTSEDEILKVLLSFPPEVSGFALELRDLLKRETGPFYELAGQSVKSFNIGYGFTTTAWDCYCAIIVYQKHINLSFPSGARLEDPERLLHGVGVRVRHLKIQCLEDVKTPAALRLLHEARENAFFDVRNEPIPHQAIKTVFKGALGKGQVTKRTKHK